MAIVASHAHQTAIANNPAYDVGALVWNADHAITGATAAQIVFGAAGGGLSQSADLSWNDTTKTMTLSGANVNVTNTHNGGVTFFNGGTGVGAAGGGLLFLPGSATTGNFAGGFLTFQSGDGHGTGAGGDITFQAGGGSLSLGTGNGGGVFINAGNGGSTSGNGGGFSLSAGFPLNGDGGLVGLYASDGAGVGNHNGGNVDMYAGVGTGTGTRGYVTFNTFSANYGVATGAGAVTRGAAVGPAAIATAIWIPVLIDGTLTYIEGFR